MVHVYDIRLGTEVSRFDGFPDFARIMHWNPDGQMLAVGGRKGILHILNPYIGESIMRWSLSVEDRLLGGFISVS